MANRMLPSGFLKTVLQNGVGRYVPQLQRVTIKFCKTHGASRGIRDFIEKELVTYAERNPSAVVYLKPRRFRTPCIVAEYLNGEKDRIVVSDMKSDEILQWIEYLSAKSGQPIMRFRKYWHTDNPSIQGVWTPFTHQPTSNNIQTFPCNELSQHKSFKPSATDQLLNLASSEQNK